MTTPPPDPFDEGGASAPPTIPQVPLSPGVSQGLSVAVLLWNKALDSPKGIRLEFPNLRQATRQRNNQYTTRLRRAKRQGGATLWDDLCVSVAPKDPDGGPNSPHYLLIFKDTALDSLLSRPIEDLP